ncbi:response regulator [Flaviaesturariibacter flavus]|uniref:Response regulator n=1 Tax=Flaviaesturariibacter flavus TaxID=2502780 RepID=A0A4V2NWK6_9BACT|nr:response regulator [Flaviaesturariibacter flavus]TCJ17702.1 response regulator [Flaviaesturariibacter flavus]
MPRGPILIIEDDLDDQEVFVDAIESLNLGIPIRCFERARAAIQYLSETEDMPYIVISDVNMPEMTGFEFRRIIKEDPFLASKGVPFIIISTDASKVAVRHAHALSVQGYFEKPRTVDDICKMFRTIFDYWELCRHINNT